MKKWILGMVVLSACLSLTGSSAEAGRFFKLMENKRYNIYDYGQRLPFHTFDRDYYNTRYPFNRHYTQQAHSFNGYPEYNR